MFWIGFIVTSSHAIEVPKDILIAVEKYCKNLDTPIVLSLIYQESSFKNLSNNNEPDGISSIGYMQVRWPTAKFMRCGFKSPRGLYNLIGNIYCGCKYLSYQLKRYGDYAKALAAYNAGSVFVCRKGKTKNGSQCIIGKFTNQKYVDSILRKRSLFMEGI